MLALKADQFLRRLDNIEQGLIALETPDGKKRFFGGKKPGPKVDMQLRDWRVLTNLAVNGDIGFAEDYREGFWDTSNLQDLLSLALLNEKAIDHLIFGSMPARIFARFAQLLRMNSLRGSRKNISFHYDLGNDFYQLWLDKTMTYSAAIFKSDRDDLMAAQHQKYDRIIDLMHSTSGRVLEIGCGWGGFAERALERGDFAIKGITLSARQKDFADQRLASSRTRAEFVLEDYRHQQGLYDHIVSIEMFEAVGEQYWKTYFDKVSELLKKGGEALIQTITISDGRFKKYRESGDFIRKHIFPGGLLPSPTLFEKYALESGLKQVDCFEFGQDYALTLERWLESFDQKKAEILRLGYDERFIRMWRFYLAGCIAGFRTERTNVMQVKLVHV